MVFVMSSLLSIFFKPNTILVTVDLWKLAIVSEFGFGHWKIQYLWKHKWPTECLSRTVGVLVVFLIEVVGVHMIEAVGVHMIVAFEHAHRALPRALYVFVVCLFIFCTPLLDFSPSFWPGKHIWFILLSFAIRIFELLVKDVHLQGLWNNIYTTLYAFEGLLEYETILSSDY